MTATRAVPDVPDVPDVPGAPDAERLRAVAGAVPDPEIPVVTLDDLGIVRGVTVSDDGTVEVALTPTYTGCPATEVIAADVERVLVDAGAARVVVRTVLAPAWTTDWITEPGRAKLRAFGIAPPDGTGAAGRPGSAQTSAVPLALTARCPRCGSLRTREISRFGSTPCKALWSCRDCGEPFDSFKAL